ncbi:MAG: EscU/YscU/HrcU family type III secretion system export apparatus switch protein [Sandaracinaceae bacterium]|nr:EscU/YscU/HrcU family type III secretion system export apparatus switch protein [Sandaracinaceae bacterium]
MDEDRPYAPSAHKLRRAREAGEVAKSPLASAAAVLAAGGAAVALAGPAWLEAWRAFAVRALSGEGTLEEAAALAAHGVAAPLAACVIAGALAGLVQVGPLLSLRALAPDAARLDPARGLARAFSPAAIGARLAPVALALAIGALALDLLRDGAGLLGRTALAPEAALGAAATLGGAFFARACALVAAAGALALAYRRWRYWREQHMSRRELAREARELHGEPGARRRRAHARSELARMPTLAEALSRAALVVEGAGLTVLVAWAGGDDAPTIAWIGRGASVPTGALPRARDAALATALAARAPGARVPARLWAELARWIARSDA